MSRVQSIARAFAVLAVVAEGPRGVTEIAERVRLPKSTVARLLAALAAEGAVEQVPGGTDYRVGPSLPALAGSATRSRSIAELATPELESLARSTGEAAGLALLEGPTVRYVAQADSANPVGIRDWTGTRIPLHVVPSGLVLLAAMPSEVIERYLAGPLERFTERTMTDPAELRPRLRTITREGVAWVRDEFADGITSVAAPVADVRGERKAALHVHGPSYRFPAPGAEAAIAGEVAAAAERLSARLREG